MRMCLARPPYERLTFQEVRPQINVKDVTTETLDGVIEGENVNAFAVFDIGTLVHDCDVPQLHSKVVSGDLIHLDLSLFNIIGAKNDEDRIAPLLSAVKIVGGGPKAHKIQRTGQ
jgi:hypothetical protein